MPSGATTGLRRRVRRVAVAGPPSPSSPLTPVPANVEITWRSHPDLAGRPEGINQLTTSATLSISLEPSGHDIRQTAMASEVRAATRPSPARLGRLLSAVGWLQ